MRLLGAMLLAVAAMLAGLHFARKLREDERQAEMSVLCVEDIREAIRYARSGKDELLAQMAEKYSELEWLGRKGGGDCYRLGLQFCRGLGASDLQGQIEYCELFAHRFRGLLKSAQRAREQKERLYISLGVFLGAALFILFI